MSNLMPDHESGGAIRKILGEPPKGVCIRVQGLSICGRPATQHVVWDPSNGSPMCDKHAAEAGPDALAVHPYTETCRITAAEWDDEHNCCVLRGEAA